MWMCSGRTTLEAEVGITPQATVLGVDRLKPFTVKQISDFVQIDFKIRDLRREVTTFSTIRSVKT